MSWVQTTLGGVCRAKKGGLALHFGVESAVLIHHVQMSLDDAIALMNLPKNMSDELKSLYLQMKSSTAEF